MEVRVHRGAGKLQQLIEIGPHQILSDAPPIHGGEDTGAEPHDLLAASLAACMAITAMMYAHRKNMDLKDIDVRTTHGQYDDAYVLTCRIRYIGNLSAAERERLTDIAGRCPVHKILSGKIRMVTEVD
jgi:putative redox protein